MNVLGLDIGFARVGFAVGSTEIQMAFPREQFPFETYLIEVKRLIETEQIEAIIIGDPKPMNGEANEHMEKTMREKEKLEDLFSLPVHVFDERFTTQIAENSLHEMGVNSKKQKKSKDSVAAAIILQNWLDSKR